MEEAGSPCTGLGFVIPSPKKSPHLVDGEGSIVFHLVFISVSFNLARLWSARHC